MATVTTHPKENQPKHWAWRAKMASAKRCAKMLESQSWDLVGINLWYTHPKLGIKNGQKLAREPNEKNGEGFCVSPKFTSFIDTFRCQDVVSWKVQKLGKFILFMAWFSGCFSFLCCYGCSTATSIKFLVSLIKGSRDHVECEAFQDFFTLSFRH